MRELIKAQGGLIKLHNCCKKVNTDNLLSTTFIVDMDAESHNFSQKSAEGDYEPSFNSLKERIEWMEFAVGDENWYQYEEDYIDVVLDIEEWNENNANNSKLSNLVKQYKDRSFFRAESFNADENTEVQY